MLLSPYKLKVQKKITKSLAKQKATTFTLIFNTKLKSTFKFVKNEIQQTLRQISVQVENKNYSYTCMI